MRLVFSWPLILLDQPESANLNLVEYYGDPTPAAVYAFRYAATPRPRVEGGWRCRIDYHGRHGVAGIDPYSSSSRRWYSSLHSHPGTGSGLWVNAVQSK